MGGCQRRKVTQTGFRCSVATKQRVIPGSRQVHIGKILCGRSLVEKQCFHTTQSSGSIPLVRTIWRDARTR